MNQAYWAREDWPGPSLVRAPLRFTAEEAKQLHVLPLIHILTIQLLSALTFQSRSPTCHISKSVQRIPGNSHSLQESTLSDKHSASAHFCLSSCCCWLFGFVSKSCSSLSGVTYGGPWMYLFYCNVSFLGFSHLVIHLISNAHLLLNGIKTRDSSKDELRIFIVMLCENACVVGFLDS